MTVAFTQAFIDGYLTRRLRGYGNEPDRLKEDAGIEETVLAGGYGYRQILELVQNGADAILEEWQQTGGTSSQGQIHVQLHDRHLYVANTGEPLSEDGVKALLSSHSSPKRGNQIGRFGLGFKSLLKLNGCIDIFTRGSTAIRFDPERCRKLLRERFQVDSVPGLRIVWPISPDERMNDPICSKLAWAETIVRAEVNNEDVLEQLREEIDSFPAEFLLFFPAPASLTLEHDQAERREIRLVVDRSKRTLHDGEEISQWYIAERDVKVTDQAALKDAMGLHARDSVPVAWAIPLEGRREEAGRFWAFFPTNTPTYLPGILNAPWKLNSDRNAIIGGEWNHALMTEAAALIAESLPALSTSDDPGRPLDAFPRRMNRQDEDAAPLIEALWKTLETCPIIPDGTGTLRAATELLRHPLEVPEQLVIRWQALAKEEYRRQLVHASCLRGQRRGRLNAFAEHLQSAFGDEAPKLLRHYTTGSWFGGVASNETTAALEALKLAASFAAEAKPADWSQIRPTLAIVPTADGKLETPRKVILAPEGESVPGYASVATDLQLNTEARQMLVDVLQVAELDDSVWMKALRQALPSRRWPPIEDDADGWTAFWARLRRAPASVQTRFLEEHKDAVHIRRNDGRWVKVDLVLLPGRLVSERDESSNSKVLFDSVVHREDRPSLELLGVVDLPIADIGPNTYKNIVGPYKQFSLWLRACRTRYKEEHKNSASWDYLEPISLVVMPSGFPLLPTLSGMSNARFTAQLLKRLDKPSYRDEIQFGHSTVRTYTKIQVPHPLRWFLLQYGRIPMGNTASPPLKAYVARREAKSLKTLVNDPEVEAGVDHVAQAFPMVVPNPEELHELWSAAFEVLTTADTVASGALHELWIEAGKDDVVPDQLPSPAGLLPLSDVFVTLSADLARRARSSGHIAVTLDDATKRLWLNNGARDLSNLIKPDWKAMAGPLERLTDVEPELAEVLKKEPRDTARCQRVTELHLHVANTSDPTPCLVWDGTLYLDTEQLSSLSRSKRLQHLLDALSQTGWLEGSVEDAWQHLGNSQIDKRREYVAQGKDLADRLLRAVGEPTEPLLKALGDVLSQEPLLDECTPRELARLVLDQLGPSTLHRLRPVLKEEGLQPPERWSATAALTFVTSIGFPPEFAASSQARREAEESVSGPYKLPPLHDFQQEVFEGLQRLFTSGSGRRRAVVSLPTGGGKTRVTAETAVRLVLAPEGNNRSVVWIAQTDELCEQAVLAFRQVWSNLGAERTDLRIVRLWGGNPNPPEQELDSPVVVVASIQTLNSRFSTGSLAWLSTPGLVVVDECHHAITPSYTNLLRWLDAEAPRHGTPTGDEPPIVGLSATPFRMDEDEKKRLAKRFDQRWLPQDQEQLYTRLRKQGVLSRPYYESLESGARFTDEELKRLDQFGENWDGLDFENFLEAFNQRLAGDQIRNERLLECIASSDERSILFFTNSVAHAEVMSLRLNHMGIPAAAISGDTAPATRRWFLESFQRGDVRVLCNYSVLTTGFDAPKTDMVLISRNVISPVRYMQMVGRGLRGEKNGGTKSCRIVTVLDNLGRFANRHPFHYCKEYFTAPEERS